MEPTLYSMTRPNGKVYRARKPPVVILFEDDWNAQSTVLVVRCPHLETARLLADIEVKRWDSYTQVGEGTFGWWRESIRNNEPFWDHDSVQGAPGWLFRIEDTLD
jgi:hypothetical protein